MKTKLLLVLLMSTYMSLSQRSQQSIQSEKLNEKREFTVSLPSSYDTDKDKKYPILVLLDGEYLLNPFEGVVRYGNYWDDLPEMIIVAINQNYGETRYKDSEYERNGLPSEKGAKFFEFMGIELLPYIEKKYRTVPFRIIAGHDITAGFLNIYLYKDNPVFNAYISLATEMPINMAKRVPERLNELKLPLFYYHAIGEKDLPAINNDANALDQSIKTVANPVFKYKFDKISGASHYSLIPSAIPSALYFIFDGYAPISMHEFQNKIALLEKGQTQYLIDKYKYLEDVLKLKVTARTTDFKAIEASILKNKTYFELQELSKYAEKCYPKSILSIYHQALYYEKMGEFKKAVKEYRKAFSRNEITEIRDLTKSYMLDRADALKGKYDDSKVEEFAEPAAPVEEVEKKEGE